MHTNIIERNNVKIIGKGSQTIMLAHGFGCDQNMWRQITPAFEEKYRIVLFDYVGSGKSDLSAYDAQRYSSLDGYAHDLIDIAQTLDLKDVVFIGHSVSAMIGILAEIRNPRLFSAMVLIGPSPCYINQEGYQGGFEKNDLVDLLDVMEQNFIGWASFLAPVIMKNEDRPELSQELEDSFCSTDPIITKQFAQATFFSDNRKDLAKINIPVLILQCADDAIAPDYVGEYTAREIPGSKLVKMQATGHCPHLSHAQETITLIRDFLTQIPQHH